jgi:hypothetical protein
MSALRLWVIYAKSGRLDGLSILPRLTGEAPGFN